MTIDFTDTKQFIKDWYTPEKLISELQEHALNLSTINANTEEMQAIQKLQRTIIEACDFLRTIKTEV